MEWEDLKGFIRLAGAVSNEDLALIEDCFNEAVELVNGYIVDFVEQPEQELDGFGNPIEQELYLGDIPQKIYERAIKETGAALFYGRGSRNNQQQQIGPVEGVTMHVPSDPMLRAYPLLKRFVGAL